ncbi:MAG: DNA ligase [Pseudomonadota bacterium]|nr:DNA ligase [Pseudomonadota bacterium]
MNLRKLTGLAILLGLFCFWSSLSFAAKVASVKPDLLLLKTYQIDQDVNGWVMSEKLDGVRAYWDGKHLISRNGKIFAVPSWFVKDFPSFELDGELWLGRQAFSEVVSIVNQQQPHNGWKMVTYQVFEVPNQKGGLLDRLSILQTYLQNKPNPYIQVIKQIPIQSNQQVRTELTRVLSLGGEGLVLRDPKEIYHTGRSSKDLKLKFKQDAECEVVGYSAGKGKYTGQIGALICEIQTGQLTHLVTQTERVIKVGSGLSDRDRKQPPKIGSVITFQYMGLTNNGLPRFPVFLRVRQSVP